MNATKQATHTPGPWHVGDGKAEIIVYARHAEGEAAANARLIAAAPDYFALLVRVAALRKRWQDNDDFGTVDYVDALGDLQPEIEAALARVAP